MTCYDIIILRPPSATPAFLFHEVSYSTAPLVVCCVSPLLAMPQILRMAGKPSLSLIVVASVASAQWSLVNTLSQELTNGGSLLGTLNAPTLPLFLNDTVSQPSQVQQSHTDM
jgi:hypothetical protein